MQVAVAILSGPEHQAAVVDAARVWGLARTGHPDEARAMRRAANAGLRALPAVAFPAVAHGALVGLSPGDPGRSLRLTWAVMRGRI
jgi:phytoene synthase